MKHLAAARRLCALLAMAAALLVWFGARHLNGADAFGARISRMSRASVHAGVAAPQSGAVPPTRGASGPQAHAAAHGKAAQPAPVHAASTPAGNVSAGAIVKTPREQLAALRVPLSPEAQNDPFSVQSWLPPPPPPPPPAPAVAVQEAPPSAPPLPFSYVGTLDRGKDKPQVFLANGDQLLIVSPGDVIDGRYRFESIAVTGAVFTYLPLNQKQMITIEGEETK
jgi:hypothetical protein